MCHLRGQMENAPEIDSWFSIYLPIIEKRRK
jgi:hypothetical protein